MTIFQGKDISIRWGELPVFVASNPEPKSWISSELDYKSKCNDVLIGRAANTSGTIEVEFDQNISSLEFLQSLQGRPISVGYSCDWFIIDDFKSWMPRTKILQSKSKQSRMTRVVIK